MSQGINFTYPKPMGLIKYLLSMVKGNDFFVMDFFAGSGTTAHAVMKLNAEDGGKRKFIMVQLPEACDEKSEAYKAGYKTIAEIGKERIHRAGKKIKAENADKEGIDQLDIGFRVLKIDSSNMKDVYYTPDTVQQRDLVDQIDNIREDRTAEDLLFQVLLDWGVDLTLPITQETIAGFTVLFVDDNALAACFDAGINEAFVKELAARHPLRVVFRDAGFASDSVKINIEQIFKLLSPHTEIKTL
jgi:adenine-specific DNA-methyltransferase